MTERQGTVLAYVLSLVGGTVLWLATAAVLRAIDPGGSPSSYLAGAASFLSFYWVAILLGREAAARVSETAVSQRVGERYPGHWSSYIWLCVVAVLVAVYFVSGLFNFSRLVRLAGGVTRPAFVYFAFGVMLPVLGGILLWFLQVKVSAARGLDLQKHYVRAMTGARNRWELSLQKLSFLRVGSGTAPMPEDAEPVEGILGSMCSSALLAASARAARRASDRRDLVAVLFVADEANKKFVYVCAAGEPVTAEYRRVLKKLEPAFFNEQEFRDRYNAFQERVSKFPKKKRPTAELLEEFRDSVQDCASTAGVVYGAERKLAFSDAFGKCLTTSFKFLEDLPEDLRARHRYRQTIGIPLACFGKKVGVLLLFSTRQTSFYESDEIYWVIGDLMALALQLADSIGYFKSLGVPSLLESAPQLKARGELVGLLTLVASLRYDFREPI